MNRLLDIITITKDDLQGVSSTIESTRPLRKLGLVRQIIIDGSTDEVRRQVEEMALNEEHVDYAWQKPSGIATAFNKGIDLAKAEWLWFLNGGDTLRPEMDCGSLLYILRTSNAEAIIFQMETKKSRIRTKHPPLWYLWPPVTNWIAHPTMIMKSRLFMTYGSFKNEYKIIMDQEMWLRIFSKKVMVDLISIPIAVFDESGVSSTQTKEISREVLKLYYSNAWMILNRWLLNGLIIMITLICHFYRRRQHSYVTVSIVNLLNKLALKLRQSLKI